MAWTTLSFSFGAILTSSQMNQLQANFTAMANGDSGAPNIQEAAMATDSVNALAIKAGAVGTSELAAGAVHRGDLSTAVEENSTTSTSCTSFLFANNDGYGFLPEVRSGTGLRDSQFCAITTGSLTDAWAFAEDQTSYGNLRLALRSDAGAFTYGRVRYINSSPPYDLGDGEVGRFVYAEVASNGEIISTWNADDPPWFNKIIKGRKKIDKITGKVYVLKPRFDFPGKWGELADNTNKMDQYVELLKTIEYEWVELTDKEKLAPMHLQPHPLVSADFENEVIIIDPPCDILHRINELMKVDNDLSPSALLHEGYLKIDNTPLQRATPPGVNAYGVRWK